MGGLLKMISGNVKLIEIVKQKKKLNVKTKTKQSTEAKCHTSTLIIKHMRTDFIYASINLTCDTFEHSD